MMVRKYSIEKLLLMCSKVHNVRIQTVFMVSCMIICCSDEDTTLVRGVANLTVSNDDEEADSEDAVEVDAEGYVDLGLTEEETRKLFNLS